MNKKMLPEEVDKQIKGVDEQASVLSPFNGKITDQERFEKQQLEEDELIEVNIDQVEKDGDLSPRQIRRVLYPIVINDQ